MFLSVSITVRREELYSTASIDISLSPDCGEDTEILFKKADCAMYASKKRGGNTFTVFQDNPENNALYKMKIENGLRSLTNNEQFQLY